MGKCLNTQEILVQLTPPKSTLIDRVDKVKGKHCLYRKVQVGAKTESLYETTPRRPLSPSFIGGHWVLHAEEQGIRYHKGSIRRKHTLVMGSQRSVLKPARMRASSRGLVLLCFGCRLSSCCGCRGLFWLCKTWWHSS